MDADSSRKYIIGAAPQCPFPDGYLGPRPGKALGDVGHMFDEVYVQFYNNWCHTGNPRVFYDHMQKWLKFSMDSQPSGPMIFVGMPAKIGGSGTAANYRPLDEVAVIFNVSYYSYLCLLYPIQFCLFYSFHFIYRVSKCIFARLAGG